MNTETCCYNIGVRVTDNQGTCDAFYQQYHHIYMLCLSSELNLVRAQRLQWSKKSNKIVSQKCLVMLLRSPLPAVRVSGGYDLVRQVGSPSIKQGHVI